MLDISFDRYASHIFNVMPRLVFRINLFPTPFAQKSFRLRHHQLARSTIASTASIFHRSAIVSIRHAFHII